MKILEYPAVGLILVCIFATIMILATIEAIGAVMEATA